MTRVRVNAECPSVIEFFELWLAHVRERVRATTYEGYECLLRCHLPPELGALPLPELTPLGLQRMYSDLLSAQRDRRALSAGTVLNLHLVLTQALGQAVRWQLLSSNPAARAQPPRPRRGLPVSVSPELLSRLLAVASGTALELPVAIAAATGMRRGEILALRWADISSEYSLAHVRATLQSTRGGLVFEQPKTARSRRAVALPAFLAPFLRRHRREHESARSRRGASWQESDLVVSRGDGSPVHPDSLSSAWRRLLRKHRLPPVRFHDLRHAHATLMLLQGVHPKVVSERLGHASVGITLDTYSHVLPSMQAQAVEAFDRLFSKSA
jgi:integrase